MNITSSVSGMNIVDISREHQIHKPVWQIEMEKFITLMH